MARQGSDQLAFDRVPDLSHSLMSAYCQVNASCVPGDRCDLVITTHFTELGDYTSASRIYVYCSVKSYCEDVGAGPINQI